MQINRRRVDIWIQSELVVVVGAGSGERMRGMDVSVSKHC